MLHHSLPEERDHRDTTYCDAKQRTKKMPNSSNSVDKITFYLVPNGFGFGRFKKGRRDRC